MADSVLYLLLEDDRGARMLRLEEASLTIGRDAACELRVDSPSVSRRHGRLDRQAGGWTYTDTGSQNGSWLNHDRLTTGRPYRIHAGDVLGITSAKLRVVSLAEALSQPQPAVSTEETLIAPPTEPPDEIDAVVSAGRAMDNDIVLSDPYVSGHHLEAWLSDGRLYVRDLESRNGTFLGDVRFTEGSVAPDAVLRLGAQFMLPASELLLRLSTGHQPSQFLQRPAGRAYLLAGRELGRKVGDKVILRDVDACVSAGQFVAIAGASGAGKSTLIKLLNGYVTPDSGVLEVTPDSAGGRAIGYVPQDDILDGSLPLREALVLSARLRYPPGTEAAAVEKRVDEVLADLGLAESASTTVRQLSGGQRKRASVALELMIRPRLLLLDEPTRGLDPASDRRLIRLLRALADSGIGVVLITHSTANITACDDVAFLAPGGYLVFWGRPDAAERYFGTDSLDAVYEQIETGATAPEWRERFCQSPEYWQLRSEVQAALDELQSTLRQPALGSGPSYASTALWQLQGLTRRSARILLADRRNLALLLLQVPVILLLARMIFAPDVLTRVNRVPASNPLLGLVGLTGARPPNFGNATPGMDLLFVAATTLVWLGTINAAREICKELPIWEREHHVGVQTLPYLLSKLLVLGGLCLVQTAIFTLLLLFFWDVPGGPAVGAGILLAGLLAALSGVAIGLTISASVSTTDRAVALVPVVMIPQILFGGTIIPLSTIGAGGQVLSWFAGARWAFEALGRITDREAYLPVSNPFTDAVNGPAAMPLAALVALVLLFSLLALVLIALRAGDDPRARLRRR